MMYFENLNLGQLAALVFVCGVVGFIFFFLVGKVNDGKES